VTIDEFEAMLSQKDGPRVKAIAAGHSHAALVAPHLHHTFITPATQPQRVKRHTCFAKSCVGADRRRRLQAGRGTFRGSLTRRTYSATHLLRCS